MILKKIFFLIPKLHGGGAEGVIITLLRHIDRKKFTLSLVVVDMEGAKYLEDVPKDIEIIDLGCRRVRYALPKLIYLVWTRQPDIVFSTLGHLNLALAMFRFVLPNKSLYLARETIVVSSGLSEYRFPILWRNAYKKLYNKFDGIICQSEDMRHDLLLQYSISPTKMMVINNPVDTNRIRYLAKASLDNLTSKQDGCLYLVAAGRLSYQKGFDLLIEAIALCQNTSIYLTILGEGPKRKELEQLAEAKGVADRVSFAGFQQNPYAFFAHADAFVLSSRYEGFPNVVLEALACGTPVIATPAPGGVKEILENVDHCLLASEVSAEALAHKLSRFVKGSRVSDCAVVPYSVDIITRQYEAVFA